MRHAARRFLPLILAAALASPDAIPGPALAADGEIDIPFEKFVLPNGLTLVVHEDHKAPIVSVNVWYHVGSKNERPGKTGFAHLFEHLMFNGSEHHDDDWFQPLARLGSSMVNGTTNNDRTNYFETVPATALDTVLWLESDRMGHLLGAIDVGKLDEQRGVVQNEKRQGENQPYGTAWNALAEGAYPAGHPYSWSVIGSMEDLDAASLDDVHAWFKSYYGAANAVLVVAGDVNAKAVHERVLHYFGDIPAGPPVRRFQTWIAAGTESRRMTMQDRVPQTRHFLVWNVPGWGTRDAHLLELAAAVLTRGEGSRLYQRTVWKERIATEVEGFIDAMEIGGQVHLQISVAPGADAAAVESAMREEVARLAAEGPTEAELATEKTQVRASFLRGIERTGGFGGTSDVLAESQVFGGSPDAWKRRLADVAGATGEDVRDAVRRWLSKGDFLLTVTPYRKGVTAKEGADRSRLPEAGPPPEARFPTLERARLDNGLEVVLARRDSVPVVRMNLLVRCGSSRDPAGAPGLARLASGMLLAGTPARNSLALRREADALGTVLTTDVDMDTITVSMTAVKENLGASVDILADVARNAGFPESELALHRSQQLAALGRETSEPRSLSLRILPRLLYGEDHPYGASWTGAGTVAGVEGIGRDDLTAFHGTWFRPNNATLVVVGDAEMESLLPLLEEAFGGWKAGEVPSRDLPAPPAAAKGRIFLHDRPGSIQSLILAAQFVAKRGEGDEAAFQVLQSVLGGQFTSRLNMNLREDKHWSYGARTRISDLQGPRPLYAVAGVQSDRTAESVAEVLKEFRAIAGPSPVTAEELDRTRTILTVALPGRWETGGSVAESIGELVTHGLPDGYFDEFAARVRALQGEAAAAAGKVLRPDDLVWLVVGDRALVEGKLRALGIGEVVVVDADGRPVK